MTIFKRETVIYDMDGSLVDTSSIVHHVLVGGAGEKKNFDAFHRASVDCPPHQWVLDAAKQDKLDGYKVIQVTARSEEYRHLSEWWIADHEVPSDGLYMRGAKDYRPDYEIKKEIVDRLLKTHDIIKAYDDNPAIVKLWGEYGIPCVVVPGWRD